MKSRQQSGQASWLPRTYFHGLMLVLIISSFFGVFRLFTEVYWWLPTLNGLYTLAPFVLLISFYLFWRQRDLLKKVEGTYYSMWLGYSLLVSGALLKIHGEIEGYPLLRGMTLIPILLGYLSLQFPKRTVRGLLFPVLFLFFAIPLPPFLIDEVTRPFLYLNTVAADAVLRLFGTDFSRTGYVFHLAETAENGVFQVEMTEGCSGLRSLFSLFALTSLYVHLRDLQVREKAALLLIGFPLAGVANIARVLATVLLIAHVSPVWGDRFFHQFSGFLVFVSTVLGLFLVESLFLKGRA